MHVDPDNTSPIFTLSYRIHRIMGGVLQIAIAVALIYSYLGKWKSFWEKLQQLEDAIGDEGAFYRQLQREITAGLALVFLVSQHFFYWHFSRMREPAFQIKIQIDASLIP